MPLLFIEQLAHNGPVIIKQFVESDVGRGCDTVVRSPLERILT
jgi:hypothetical protein